MNATTRIAAGAAALGVLFGCSQLTPAPARAGDELHNVTYITRIDGVAPGTIVTFRINDNQTNTADLGALPGNTFEANTVLADPAKAGAQVSLKWPYSANVHCEIDVDDTVAVQVNQFVSPKPGDNNTGNGVLSCGAPIPDATGAAAR
jgi:hypothetical protein